MENSENSGTGSCEKIGFANFASDLKCIPTSQTSFIGDSEQKFARLNSRQIREIDFFTASRRTGGPLKLGFSLSGVILLVGTASPLPVRVFVLSILTRFRLLPQCLSRNEESCSTASPPDARTVRDTPCLRDFIASARVSRSGSLSKRCTCSGMTT